MSLVSTEWLAKNLESVVPVDGSYNGPETHQDYLNQHLPVNKLLYSSLICAMAKS